jgi:hypothetical protein
MDSATKPPVLFVYFGSPTRWLSTDVPVRSFLQSDTATRVLGGNPFAVAVCCRRYWKHNLKTVRRRGGAFADGIHFRYQGGQARSLLSLLSYLGSGEYRDRYLGIKIPLTNIQDYHLREARKFAGGERPPRRAAGSRRRRTAGRSGSPAATW